MGRGDSRGRANASTRKTVSGRVILVYFLVFYLVPTYITLQKNNKKNL
jgi:hypothetical protein